MGIQIRDWYRDWWKERQYKEDGTRRFKGWRWGALEGLQAPLFLEDDALAAVQRAPNESVEVRWALHLFPTTLTCLAIYGVIRLLPHLIRVYTGVG